MSLAQGSFYSSDNRTIGLISLAHGTSHFYHLVLTPLFPWLKMGEKGKRAKIKIKKKKKSKI